MKFTSILQAFMVMALAFTAVNADKKKEIDGPVIGIDLGTTYSCVGIFKNGRVEIIPNELGNRITPSYVAFTDDERLVGEAAKNQAHMNPSRSINVVKRLIGRNFEDKEVQRDVKYLGYKVVSKGGKPYVSVELPGNVNKELSPEEISAMILIKMKEVAENYLGREVKHAVITVPAYFNDSQRQATKDAGTISGLDVLRIINEPTAAAIAYGMDKKSGEKNIIVFDLGGGTFDVSLLQIDNGVFEVLATAGDTHLGGEDFDQRLTDHFVKAFKKKTDIDIKKDQRALQKLKVEVEKAKRDLSSVHQVKVQIDNLIDGEDFSETITRARFEELCSELFKSTLNPVEQVLDDADMKKSEIDEIVLVGGSTRIPKIQELLSEFFNQKQLNKGINPDEAVAYGAAVQGGILGGEPMEDQGILLIDVTPLSLGVGIHGGLMSVVIPRGTTIPTKKTQVYTNAQDYQTSVRFPIYEGERPKIEDNHQLGAFQVDGIPPARKGQSKMSVTFEIDENSILTVTASDHATGKKESITITNEKDRLSKEDIEKMVRDSEKFAEQDKQFKQKIEAKHQLERYITQMGTTISEQVGDKLSKEDKYTIQDALDDQQAWLDANPEADAEDYEDHLKELQRVCDPIIGSLYQHMGGQGKGGDEDEDFDDDL